MLEALSFWTVVGLIWLYFHLTTHADRKQHALSFWVILLAAGGIGFLYELLH